MSRSRKVEAGAAVSAAMSLFWSKGYASLGTRQIEEETGITRFTLQTTYGGKMKLFLTALDRYLDLLDQSEMLASIDAGLEGIAQFFETRADPTQMHEDGCQGCFLLNTLIEFSADIPEVNKRATRYFTTLRQKFATTLEDTLIDKTKVAARTEVLVSATLGLNAMIRAHEQPQPGVVMANAIGDMVRSWGEDEQA